MKTISLIIIAIIVLAGCTNKTGEADAYGNFEVTEVIISAETNGRILRFDAREGSLIVKGTELALIDTTFLDLQKDELEAQIKSVRTKLLTIKAQNDVLNQQIENNRVNISRIEKMLKDDAATMKQLDDLTGQEAVFRKQIEANNTQKISVAAELSVYDTKRATLIEQLRRSSVKSPLTGSILEKYSEAGEITSSGKPLAKIADMSIIKLKVYVSGAQIAKIKTAKQCTVRIDDGKNEYRSFTGTISYVSEKAEFTPKIIQTKEERVILVYAVKIDIINDGSLKEGMPGEAIFTEKTL
jgi:HlyD family secretion protein